MYLSRIALNPARRATATFVASPHVVHGAVMKAFPPEAREHPEGSGRILWRLDHSRNDSTLYVVSPAEPDFTHIVEQTGWPTTTAWTTRKYDELLDRLTAGQHWHFRLTANPVRHTKNTDQAVGEPGRSRGKPNGLTSTQQLDWLRGRADTYGFAPAPCGPAHQREDDIALVTRHTHRFRRGPATITLSTATYEGTLIVTDPARLQTALTTGIGRAKGYGCGLLTLAPTSTG